MASGKFPTILTDSKSLKVTADFENGKIYVSPGLFLIAGKYEFFKGGQINFEKRSCRIGFEVSADFFTKSNIKGKKAGVINGKEKIELAGVLDLQDLQDRGWNINLEEGTASRPDDGFLYVCPTGYEPEEDTKTECKTSDMNLDVVSLKSASSISIKLITKPISSNKLDDDKFFKPIATVIIDDKNKKVYQHIYGPCIFFPTTCIDYNSNPSSIKCLFYFLGAYMGKTKAILL